MLELAYKHPRTGELTRIRQAVRIARQQPYDLQVGARASAVCWGVTPSGMLRHPPFSTGFVSERFGSRCESHRAACSAALHPR